MFRNIVLTLLFATFALTLQAQEPFKERIFAVTSQEEYAAGSDVWFSLATLDADCRPLAMSRVAAVELFNDKQMLRVRIALEDGRGRGFIRLPETLAPGRYTLMAYTRNMQNEGEEFFFTKSIDIVRADTGVRESSVCTRAADSLAFERFKAEAKPIVHVAHVYRPEVDGEVILGRFVPDNGYKGGVRMPNLSILGTEIHYYPGSEVGDNLVEYVTPVLTGQTTLFTGCKRGGHVELLEPYRPTPSSFGNESEVRGRGEVATANSNLSNEEVTSPPARGAGGVDLLGLHLYTPQRSYDLDQWRRFDTFKEMFLEFMPTVTTVNTDEGERIAMFEYNTDRFNDGNTLVLLDGVAVTVHEDLLRYDPHMVKFVDLYYGYYFFGHEHYTGIFSCTTHKGNLPRYELPDNTCVNHYDAVQQLDVVE
ncbi:MAG: hypothetical protein Q4D23_03830 [Bacteroidales bacterium]|nr:hypothetical protein [Bacteroidales bacterium]